MGPPVLTDYRGFRLVTRRGLHTLTHPTRPGLPYYIVAVMRGTRLIELFLDRQSAKDWIDLQTVREAMKPREKRVRK